MSYFIEYEKDFLKALKKLDKPTAKRILDYIKNNLENCENPRDFGKGLTADKSGFWRYRVGNYRIIAEIQDDKLVIVFLSVGHRSQIYRDKR